MASLSKDTDASGNPVLGDIGVHLTKTVRTPVLNEFLSTLYISLFSCIVRNAEARIL